LVYKEQKTSFVKLLVFVFIYLLECIISTQKSAF